MKQVVLVFAIVTFFSLLTGCVQPERGFTEVNETYSVRNVYFGYINGVEVTAVRYFYGGEIKTIDDRSMHYVDFTRSNIIQTVPSPTNETSLYKWQRSNGNDFPRGRYVLYLSNSTEVEGMDTYYGHSRGEDEVTSMK